MSEPKKGYGPPLLESLRIERLGGDLHSFAAPSAEETSGEPIRVTLRGTGFAMRAMPLVVEIGDQATARIAHSMDGRSITCEFPRLPAEGAAIRVGYPPDDFAELPERFSLSMLEEAEPGGGS